MSHPEDKRKICVVNWIWFVCDFCNSLGWRTAVKVFVLCLSLQTHVTGYSTGCTWSAGDWSIVQHFSSTFLSSLVCVKLLSIVGCYRLGSCSESTGDKWSSKFYPIRCQPVEKKIPKTGSRRKQSFLSNMFIVQVMECDPSLVRLYSHMRHPSFTALSIILLARPTMTYDR